MPASAEVRYRITGDTSSLSRSFVAAESIAAAAGKTLHKKLGLQDAIKAFATGVGVNIEKISEKIAEMFTGGSQEAWKQALDSAKETARIIEESTLRRMSTARQIAEIEAQIRRGQEDEKTAPKQTAEVGNVRRALDAIGMQMFGGGAKLFGALGMKNAARSFAEASAQYQARGEEMVKESPAEAAARAAEATKNRLEREAKIAELKEQQRKDEERIADARRALNVQDLDGVEKTLALIDDIETAQRRLNEQKRNGASTTEAELALIERERALKEHIKQVEEKATRDLEKREEDKKRADEEAKRRAEALARVVKAEQGLSGAQHDTLAFSLDDAVSGKRGNATDRAKAREIARLEKRARQLYDRNEVIYDPSGQFELSGEMLQSRANELRKNFSRLKKDDQNPFSGAEDQLKEANEYLKNIDTNLAIVEIK